MEPAAGTVLHEMVHGDGPCMRHNELAYIQARLPTGLQSAFNSQQGCEHVTATTSSGTPQTIWRERCLQPDKVNFACGTPVQLGGAWEWERNTCAWLAHQTWHAATGSRG